MRGGDAAPDVPPPPLLRACLGGAVAGLALFTAVLGCGPSADEDRPVTRPLAPASDAATWTRELERRGPPLFEFPDPPGDGPVSSTRWWVSLPAYEMELRRRGPRVTLGIRGVDVQSNGGGWTAFAEGTITAPGDALAGAEARIVWSCVGLRHRACTDGVARLVFAKDGRTFETIYLQATEALAIPAADTYVRAFGRVAEGKRPPYGVVQGQIPYTARLRRHPAAARIVVRGLVRTPEGAAVADALVQLKGHDRTRTTSDVEGRFELELRGADAPWTQSICAGAIGYRNGETVLFTGDPTERVVVELVPVDLSDHPDYKWVHPAPDRDPDDAQACGTCHSWQYAQWVGSRHARSADDGHVVYERAQMLRRAPDAPDDCVGCHQPAFAVQAGPSPYVPRGVLASNHCDFCHKVRHVEDVRAPGVFGSLVLARPDPAVRDRPGDTHRVFGPAADVSYAYMGASWNPMLSTSWLCAGCHQGGGLPGRPKINTFEEWRRWAAAREGEAFRSCQDCHMKGGVARYTDGRPVDQLAWESLHRTPAAVHSHAFEGTEPSFARDALKIEVAKRFDRARGLWFVDVTLENVGAGHRIPTGTWTKHVVVGVWAQQGKTWLAAGPGVPRARVTDVDPAPDAALEGGDRHNPPGTVLGVFDRASARPLAAFYDPPDAKDVVDTRLAPDERRTLALSFRPAESGGGAEPRVTVRVVHRRGEIGAGVAQTPWDLHPYDAPPEVEWARIER